jgi:hypothetical protein
MFDASLAGDDGSWPSQESLPKPASLEQIELEDERAV